MMLIGDEPQSYPSYRDIAVTNKECVMDERTRRELFSALALQGILASKSEENQKDQARPGEVAQWARAYADALIAELTREQVAGGQ
jgi:hypothetical protein